MDPLASSSDSPEPPPSQPGFRWIRILEAVLFVSGILIVRSCLSSEEGPDTGSQPESTPRPLQVALAPPEPVGALFGPPTPQTRWRDLEDPKVYMPTGSGRVESASYGSVRTRSSGRASFHEGVDIAPTEWKRNVAQDPVFAVADGDVAYFSRVGGNSSYGKYIVIRHPDPLGDVFTLYAHLASVESTLRQGEAVRRGDQLGVMGHSSTLGIPRQRSHLHFELCLMLNPEFDQWYRSEKLKPNHQAYHGWNLAGLNPHLLLSRLHETEEAPFSFEEALNRTPPAWSLVIRSTHRPNFFSSYPGLWKDGPYQGQAVVIEASESGVPLSGRNATAEEFTRMENGQTLVLDVKEDALGRNGLRHIVKDQGRWRLGKNGERWLEILLYRSR